MRENRSASISDGEQVAGILRLPDDAAARPVPRDRAGSGLAAAQGSEAQPPVPRGLHRRRVSRCW